MKNTKIIQKKREHYKVGDFTDLVTLICREGSYADASSSISQRVDYCETKYPVRCMFLENSESQNSITIEGQNLDDVTKHKVILNTWPKSLDTTWAVEWRKQLYKIKRMKKHTLNSVHYMILNLTELGNECNQSSYE